VRPDPVHVHPYRARIDSRRGCRSDGRWYWRVERYRSGDRHDVRAMPARWATVEEIAIAMRGLPARPDAPAAGPVQAHDVEWLAGYYLGHYTQRAAEGLCSVETTRSVGTSLSRLLDGLAAVQLVNLNADHVRRWVSARRMEGLAPLTIRLDVRRLRAMVAWGRRTRRIPRAVGDEDLLDHINGCAPKPVRTRPRQTPAAGRVTAVLAHLSPGWPHLVGLILATYGCRIGEVADLTVGSVDLQEGTLHLRGKTGARLVPLLPDVRAALVPVVAGRRAEERLLPVARTTVRSEWGWHHLTAACLEAGVPRLTPHAFRRSAITRLLTAGVDAVRISKICGVSVQLISRDYDVPEMEDLAAHLASISPSAHDVRAPRFRGRVKA